MEVNLVFYWDLFNAIDSVWVSKSEFWGLNEAYPVNSEMNFTSITEWDVEPFKTFMIIKPKKCSRVDKISTRLLRHACIHCSGSRLITGTLTVVTHVLSLFCQAFQVLQMCYVLNDIQTLEYRSNFTFPVRDYVPVVSLQKLCRGFEV